MLDFGGEVLSYLGQGPDVGRGDGGDGENLATAVTGADRVGGNTPLRAVPVLNQRHDRVVGIRGLAARPGVGGAVGADRVQLAIRRLAGRGGDVAPGLAVPVLDEAGAGVLAHGPDVAGARPGDAVEGGCGDADRRHTTRRHGQATPAPGARGQRTVRQRALNTRSLAYV